MTDMKTTRIHRMAFTALTLALLAGGGFSAMAGDSSLQRDATRVIRLHAPNHTSQTITVWTSNRSKHSYSSASTATAKTVTQKAIGVPAPNGSVQTVTVWTESATRAYEVAPLK